MKVSSLILGLLLSASAFSQSKKVELFNLIKKFVPDSTGYSTTGDWGIGKPSMYPVQWEADKIEMSEDLSINFYRKGTANIYINTFGNTNTSKSIKWNIMLMGARMGYSSFTITSSYEKDFTSKKSIDSLFGKQTFTYKLLKDCSKNSMSGFYFYEVKIPKKTPVFIKLSWSCNVEGCRLTINGYDDWSKQYANTDCR